MELHLFEDILNGFALRRSYGVMVSTLDSESSDPSSNLGKTYKAVSNYFISDGQLYIVGYACNEYDSKFVCQP